MIVRPATARDIPAVNAIANHYILHSIAHFSLSPVPDHIALDHWLATRHRFPCYVADDAGRVLGFARASQWKSRCAYDWAVETSVYLLPDATGKGLGSALYRRLFTTLQRQGFRTAIAGIALPNDPSVRLHERLGMHHAGTFPSVGYKFNRWIDVGYWIIRWPGPDPPTPPRPVALADPDYAPALNDP